MQNAKDVLKAIKDNDVKYVDFRFTDPRGKWQHVTFDVSIIDEDTFAEGVMFDGSSIAGWKAINESDMTLMPDPVTAVMDPFYSAADPVDRLRHPRAGDRRALQPRSARHGEEGRGLPQIDGRRRHDLRRPGGRVLRLRRREVHGRPLQHRASSSTPRSCRSTATWITRAATSATASRPRPATSRCRRRTRRRTCAARCSPPWRRWASRSRSTTTRSPPPSTSSA